MKTTPTFVIAAIAAAAMAASSANAALTPIYSTNFNSPTYADGALIGQDAWVITGTSVVAPITVANTATNGTVTLAATGQDVNRPFTPTITSDSAYLSATINVASSAGTAGDYFLHLSDGTTNAFNARLYAKNSGTGYVFGVASSSGAATYGTAVESFGTNYTVLLRYDFITGASNDLTTLFVNPTTADGTGNTSYASAVTNAAQVDAVTISAVNLRQGSGGPLVTVDNIAVSSGPTPAAVPEPTTLAAIAGVAIVGGLRRRRA